MHADVAERAVTLARLGDDTDRGMQMLLEVATGKPGSDRIRFHCSPPPCFFGNAREANKEGLNYRQSDAVGFRRKMSSSVIVCSRCVPGLGAVRREAGAGVLVQVHVSGEFGHRGEAREIRNPFQRSRFLRRIRRRPRYLPRNMQDGGSRPLRPRSASGKRCRREAPRRPRPWSTVAADLTTALAFSPYTAGVSIMLRSPFRFEGRR